MLFVRGPSKTFPTDRGVVHAVKEVSFHVRAHPTAYVPVGQTVYLVLPPEQCVAVADETAPVALAEA